jgi:hypothetical protein
LEHRVIVHGRCHEKALVGIEPMRQVLSEAEGLDFTILDSGCCEMVGSFGYEQGYYKVSRTCGRRRPMIWSSPPASAAATGSPTSATVGGRCPRPELLAMVR